MNVPMREKHVDENVGHYYIYGVNPTTGNVDVYCAGGTADDDVFADLPADVGNALVALHVEFKEKVYQLLCAGMRVGERVKVKAGEGL
jgi:hypothetical protein